MLNHQIDIQHYYADISDDTRHKNLKIIKEQRMKFQTALSEISDLDLKQEQINEAFRKLITIRALKSDLYDLNQEIKTLDDPKTKAKIQGELDTTALLMVPAEENVRVALQEIIPFSLQMEEYLNQINRNHLQEMRALRNPPEPVMQVLYAIEELTGNRLLTYPTERRARTRSSALEPQAYLHALLYFDFDNIPTEKVASAREFFNNTSEERTRYAGQGARALYQWLQVFFQMHAINSTQTVPAKAQLQSIKVKREDLFNLRENIEKKLQTLISDKSNLEIQIKEIQDQQQSTVNEHAKLIWLSSTNQFLINLERSLEDNSKSQIQQLNESKIIDLDHLSFDNTPAHQLMLRLFKINLRICQESQAYTEKYSLFYELVDIEIQKQKQILGLQYTIESEQKQISNSESILKELNVNQQRIADEIKITQQEIKLSQQRQKEISQKLSQPVNPKLKSQDILQIKSQDPSKETYMLIKLLLQSINKDYQTWTDFMHNTSQIYLSMKTTKLQDYELSSIVELQQRLNDSYSTVQYQQNSPESTLSDWLKKLASHMKTFKQYDDENQKLAQLQDKLQKFQHEQAYFKQSLDQEQQKLKTLKSSLESNQAEMKKIKDSCTGIVDFFQGCLVKYNDDYIHYFQMVRSYTMQTILQLFHNYASIEQISIMIQILEYNTYSSQFLQFVFDKYILDLKSDSKNQAVQEFVDKCEANYEKFKDFEIFKEWKHYTNIEKNQQRFLIEYCYKFQEIKKSYELLIPQ